MAHGPRAVRRGLGGAALTLSKRRLARGGAVAVLALLLSAAIAQPASAADAYREAEEAYAAALNAAPDRAPLPDDPAWRAAMDAVARAMVAGETEVELAWRAGDPASAEVLAAEAAYREAMALGGRLYGSLKWHGRAFPHWEMFLAAGGEVLDESHPPAGLSVEQAATFPTDLSFVTEAVSQLAFARYSAGDLAGARAYYLTLLDLQPANPEALRWLARLAFEEGDTATAIQIWGRLVEVAPDDEGARFFLELSRERDEFGVEASDAYRAGIRAYEAGMLDGAFAQFVRAYELNPRFADAAVWAARSALEAGRPAQAEPYWQAALEVNPADQRSAWFLEFTRAQMRWGVEPASDFYAGQTAYGEADLERARELFLSAATANPDYQDAWVWAARSSQEAGFTAEAIEYWQEVLRLAPGDERARYFLNLAQQQLAFGPEAGEAFASGLAAYQAGDVERARAGLSAAVAAAPDFAEAWSQLARLEFQVGAYAAAAEAYGRALELDPGNDEYEFFAAEARRLAGAAAPQAPDADDATAPADSPDSPDETDPAGPPAPDESEPPAPDAGDDAPDTEIVPLPPAPPGGQ